MAFSDSVLEPCDGFIAKAQLAMDNFAVATETQRRAFGLIGTALPLSITAVMMPPPRLNVEPTPRVAGGRDGFAER